MIIHLRIHLIKTITKAMWDAVRTKPRNSKQRQVLIAQAKDVHNLPTPALRKLYYIWR